jgi:hypothetical protein
MQNKANFLKDKTNANLFAAKDYENKSNWKLGENKPKQTQFFTGSSIWFCNNPEDLLK